MSRIINDFIDCSIQGCGVGCFQNNPLAISYSKTVGANQLRKYRKYGIVPAAFIAYLKASNALQPDAWLPERKRTVHGLLDLLCQGPERPPGEFSEGEALREALLVEMFPELKNAMGSSERIWQTFERDGSLFGLNGRGGTSKAPDYLDER